MPDYWMMNYPYSEQWDKELNELMDKYPFRYISDFDAKLGAQEIWIENHPYASFRPDSRPICPSRMTIVRAKRKLDRDTISNGMRVPPPPPEPPSEEDRLREELAAAKDRIKQLESLLID